MTRFIYLAFWLLLLASTALFPSQNDSYLIDLNILEISNTIPIFGIYFFVEEIIYFAALFLISLNLILSQSVTMSSFRLTRGSFGLRHYIVLFVLPFLITWALSFAGNAPFNEIMKETRLLIYSMSLLAPIAVYHMCGRVDLIRRAFLLFLPSILLLRFFALAFGLSQYIERTAAGSTLAMRSGDFAAHCAALIIFYWCDLLMHERVQGHELLFRIIATILAASQILFAAQYAAILFLAAGIGSAIMLKSSHRLKWALIVSAATLFLFLAGDYILRNWLDWRMRDYLEAIVPAIYYTRVADSFEDYFALWHAGVREALRHNVILGLGFGKSVFVYIPRIGLAKEWLYIHNIHLELFMKGGGILFASWFLFLSRLIRTAKTYANQSSNSLACASIIIGFLFMGCFNPSLIKVRLALLFWGVVGTVICIAITRPNHSSQSPTRK